MRRNRGTRSSWPPGPASRGRSGCRSNPSGRSSPSVRRRRCRRGGSHRPMRRCSRCSASGYNEAALSGTGTSSTGGSRCRLRGGVQEGIAIIDRRMSHRPGSASDRGRPQGQKRAIRATAPRSRLTRSHIANIWRSGQDSQAFCAWDGAGPYTLTDNYLEAAERERDVRGRGQPGRGPRAGRHSRRRQSFLRSGCSGAGRGRR